MSMFMNAGVLPRPGMRCISPQSATTNSAVLAQTVPNPFFGNPAFAGTALGNQATTTRGQLLRPFPGVLH